MMASGPVLRRLGVLLSVVLVLVLGGCGAETETTPTTGPTVTDIRVGLIATGSMLPVRVAEAQGIFERHGLRVAITEGPDPAMFLAGLAQNQYDVVTIVPTTVLVGAERGVDVVVVSRMQESTAEEPNAVWVTRDGSIDSIEQLAGRRIGVPALTGVITDSLVYLLQRAGVDHDDVELVPVPFPAMGDHLQQGRVDAVVAPIPFGAELAARGFRVHEDVVVEAVRDASEGAVETGMTALTASSGAFVREHPDTIEAWRASLSEAIDYLDAHEAEARMLLQTWLKMPPEVAERAPLPGWAVEISPDDLRPYVTISNAVGTIHTEPDVDELVWQGP